MNARDYALAQLDSKTLPGWPSELPDSVHRSAPPADARDLALAEQLSTGVVKNLLHLKYLIHHYAQRPLKQIDPLVQKILAIGLYQLRFLTRVPASAAVNEAVGQTARFRRRSAGGFVNAILRRASREAEVPLPTEAEDPQRYAEIVLSHPVEVYQRLRDLVGVEKAIAICRHNNRTPPTLVRPFGGVTPEQLVAEGVTLRPHELPNLFVVEGAKQATLAGWARSGVAQVQDATAALVVPELQLQQGMTVLDRCAGLGTKTLQIRDRIGESGLVVAMDPSGPRCEGLRKTAKKRQLTNVYVHQAAMLEEIREQLLVTAFDRILVDAPCSNSGVLARRPEARYHQDKRSLASLSRLAHTILEDSLPHLRPDGLLLYSTCSIWPEENEMVVERFVRAHPLTVVASKLTLPSTAEDPMKYCDGGFYAVLRRSG